MEGSTCPVCLDPLGSTGPADPECVLAMLACGHVYHDDCIKTWADRTNSCPACRTKFNEVVLTKGTPPVEIYRYKVDDKVAPVPDDYQTETSHNVAVIADHERQDMQEDDYMFEEQYVDCALCMLGELSHRHLTCRTCAQEVHVCSGDPEAFPFIDWMCPLCLNAQVSYLNVSLATRRRVTTSRRSTRGRTTPSRSSSSRAARSQAPSPSARPSIIGSLLNGSAITSTSLPRLAHPSLSAYSYDTSASQSSASSPPPPPALPPVMTAEETEAWEMMERAQSEISEEPSGGPGSLNHVAGPSNAPTASSSSVVPMATPEKKFKRPCRRSSGQPFASPSSVPSTASSFAAPPEPQSEPTLVQSLLSNIRSGSPKVVGSRSALSPTASPFLLASTSAAAPFGSSPSQSPGQSPVASNLSLSGSVGASPDSSPPASPQTTISNPNSATESSSSLVMAPTAPSDILSLEKKLEVQTVVRQVLRPLYRAGTIDKEQYTAINRRVSRALYERLAGAGSVTTGEWAGLAESCVRQELQAIQP